VPLRGLADAWHRCHMAARSLLGVEESDLVMSLSRRTDADAQQLLDELTDVSVKIQALSNLTRRQLAGDDDIAADAG